MIETGQHNKHSCPTHLPKCTRHGTTQEHPRMATVPKQKQGQLEASEACQLSSPTAALRQVPGQKRAPC